MKKTKFKFIILTLFTLISSSVLATEVDLHISDTKLACEAASCLFFGNRTSDCIPSLTHYFEINHRNRAETVKRRLNFLSLCPTSGYTDMPILLRAIANSAGRCDAEYLNKYNIDKMRKTTCSRSWLGANHSCHTEDVQVISDKKPNYCSNYVGAYGMTTKYIGTPTTNGFWADVDDYEFLLKKYHAKQTYKNNIPGINRVEVIWEKIGRI